jgi:phage terminase large subunit
VKGSEKMIYDVKTRKEYEEMFVKDKEEMRRIHKIFKRKKFNIFAARKGANSITDGLNTLKNFKKIKQQKLTNIKLQKYHTLIKYKNI